MCSLTIERVLLLYIGQSEQEGVMSAAACLSRLLPILFENEHQHQLVETIFWKGQIPGGAATDPCIPLAPGLMDSALVIHPPTRARTHTHTHIRTRARAHTHTRCMRAHTGDRNSRIYAMSYQHTRYVTSSYILCHTQEIGTLDGRNSEVGMSTGYVYRVVKSPLPPTHS